MERRVQKTAFFSAILARIGAPPQGVPKQSGGMSTSEGRKAGRGKAACSAILK